MVGSATMAKSTREERAKRVRRWKQSGLTAREFEARTGINARTLSYWKWRLGKEGHLEAADLRRSSGTASLEFVELETVMVDSAATTGIEVLVGRYVVRLGPGVDAATLGQVLDVLEQRG
jgi:transposase